MAQTHTAANVVDPLPFAVVSPGATLTKTVVPGPVEPWRFYGGLGRIDGTVKVDSSPDYPVHRRVRCFRDRDAVCVGETWSDPTTGAYSFECVDPAERYTVLAYDYTGAYRAVVADNLTPDPM